jgi:Cu(I)/Ag(I) efflux system membrane fusion protein
MAQEPDGRETSGESPKPTHRQQFKALFKLVEVRLRFVALMALTALVFANWDTIGNHIDRWRSPHVTTLATDHARDYFCPMHPSVVREVAGSCPICGMPLSQRMKGAIEELPNGVSARVRLQPDQIAQAGIRTLPIGYQSLTQSIKTVGTIVIDERRLARIASRTKGASRIEKLLVNFTGTPVSEGQPLAEIYSPELYQATQELLIAHRAANNPTQRAGGLSRETFGDARELVRSTSEKLSLWGMTQAQIDTILREGKATYQSTLVAPIGGVVIRKNVVEGQYVNEGEPLFELADLSHLWIQAHLFEHQIASVNVGDTVRTHVSAFPGEVFAGTVAFIEPVVSANTRTAGVRIDVPNLNGRLRPGMFADVSVDAPLARDPAVRPYLTNAGHGTDLTRLASLTVEQQKICLVTGDKLGSMGKPVPISLEGKSLWACCTGCEPTLRAEPKRFLAKLAAPADDAVLVVPESAVIDTGERTLVFFEAEPGVFEARAVKLGPRVGEYYSVLEGLEPGANVATSGAFLLDAETRLNPALSSTSLGGSAGAAVETDSGSHVH